MGKKFESDKPIGIFDSGVGGLTVLKEVVRHLPEEGIIYLGDTARVPYGIKSPETVIKFSRQNAGFLQEKGIKLLIAACNTSSAVSLPILQEEMSIPVIGVIEPGARAAVKSTKTGRIGVIGTEATIKSRAYEKAIKNAKCKMQNEKLEVIAKPCPLFVPLAEEGWLENRVADMTAEIYLKDLRDKGVDVLVLGCTHYPLLKKTIQKFMGDGVILIDSAEETAREAESLLKEKEMLSNGKPPHLAARKKEVTLCQERRCRGKSPIRDFYVSDNPKRFSKVGKIFLGENGLVNLSVVDLSQY